MSHKMLKGLVVLVCSLVLLFGLWGQAKADTSVSGTFADATFDFSAGSLTITLTATKVNPTSVAQLLSGISFDINGVDDSLLTLNSSSGTERTVNAGGTYTVGGTGSTGWILDDFGTGSLLCVICPTNAPVAPAHLLIGNPDGSNLYSAANGSIANNGPHNPFLYGSITFTILNSAFADSTTVSNVVFYYGTTWNGTSTPEPGSLLLLGAGLMGLGIWRWKKGEA